MLGNEVVNITTQTTTTIFSDRAILKWVIINNPQDSGSVVIYNNTAGSGTKVGTILRPASQLNDAPIRWGSEEGIVLGVGCTIVTSGANQDITVQWAKTG